MLKQGEKLLFLLFSRNKLWLADNNMCYDRARIAG